MPAPAAGACPGAAVAAAAAGSSSRALPPMRSWRSSCRQAGKARQQACSAYTRRKEPLCQGTHCTCFARRRGGQEVAQPFPHLLEDGQATRRARRGSSRSEQGYSTHDVGQAGAHGAGAGGHVGAGGQAVVSNVLVAVLGQDAVRRPDKERHMHRSAQLLLTHTGRAPAGVSCVHMLCVRVCAPVPCAYASCTTDYNRHCEDSRTRGSATCQGTRRCARAERPCLH